MKKIAILGICVLLLAVFAYSAAAAVVVESGFSENSATFGGDNQKASNPNLDDDDSDYDIYVDGNVNLRNDGSSAVAIDKISVTYKMGFSAEDLNITLKEGAVINGSNSTGAVKLHARVSEKLDAVNEKQKAVAFNVAEIRLMSGTTTVATFDAYMQRENQLELDKVKVEIGDSSTTVNEDGDTVDEAKPGDTVKFTVYAENKYSDDDDVEIDADDGKWEIGGDIDEDDDIDFGSMSADSKDEIDFSFTLEDDVDDGTEDFLIYVYGEDDFGAKHGHRIVADFEVKKENHEIKILDMSVVPDKANCGESFTVQVHVVNIGKKDEREVSIRVMNADVEIDGIVGPFELDEGDDVTKTFDFTVPSDTETGAKAFTVIAAYDMTKESDRETFSLNVASCGDDEPDDEPDEPADEPDAPAVIPPAITGGTATAQPTDNSVTTPSPVTTVSTGRGDSGFRDSTVYVLLLILAIVVVVMAGAFMTAKLLIVR